MGDFRVKQIENNQQRAAFYLDMIRDLEALEIMLNEGLIDHGSETIGAEQELCLIDEVGDPASRGLDFLDKITDPHYTNELALFNLEINLDPLKLHGHCFSTLEENLNALLSIGHDVGKDLGTDIFLTGILPTIKFRHLQFENMTPERRYKLLSNDLLERRGGDFEIYLDGVDHFNTTLKSVLFEACNTSFQLHLQIAPDEFVDQFNWAQMISGPVLSACTNSPLLFGKELWAENRIGLFKQSLDTRNTKNHQRVKMSRVYFGDKWLTTSPVDLWRNELVRFPLILIGENVGNSLDVLEEGHIPALRSIRLHNGTTYTWNRLCYGRTRSAAHIRIECRYLPSGPTVVDEIANFVFWIGLMKAMPDNWNKMIEHINFRTVKDNFIRAARTGVQSVFYWMGKYISARDLIMNELLPMAQRGLLDHGVDAEDVRYYLGIIADRVSGMKTGSIWMVDNFRRLLTKHNSVTSSNIITTTSSEIQNENIPVHEWPDTKLVYPVTEPMVEHLMRSKIYAIQEDHSIRFAKYIMEWKGIGHLPVENKQGVLMGIISKRFLDEIEEDETVKDHMTTELITCLPSCTKSEARRKLEKHGIHSLLVVEENRLVGIVTDTDVLD
ncbi:MAG: CBS domain-containing protein [Saprospiraceae bacterium]|nr:CBS domain-containing protein [Saprospiraceae bacterium]